MEFYMDWKSGLCEYRLIIHATILLQSLLKIVNIKCRIDSSEHTKRELCYFIIIIIICAWFW